MHRAAITRFSAPFAAMVSPAALAAAALALAQVGTSALAADDGVAAAAVTADVPLERVSDAPWKLARRAAPQRLLELELHNPASARPALEFQRPSRSASMPIGQLRMTLSETSSLAFRPRSGGLNVTYREKF